MKKYMVEKGFYNNMTDAHISYENEEIFNTYEEAIDYFEAIILNDSKEFPEYKELNIVEIEDDEVYFLDSLKYESRGDKDEKN